LLSAMGTEFTISHVARGTEFTISHVARGTEFTMYHVGYDYSKCFSAM